MCDGNDATAFDVFGGSDGNQDAPIDVVVDTFVKPDGDVPDGECNAGAEDCSNGLDDNCNGLVDCADPVCQTAGYVCTAAVPSGWSGPVALATASGSTIPGCGGAYATASSTGHDGFSAASATCGCGCTGPLNVSCSTGVGITYYSDACATNVGGAGLPANFCVTSGGSGVTNVKANAQATSYNGDCTGVPSKTVPPASWTSSFAACAYDGKVDTGGCTASATCVQAPSGGLGTKTCIYQAGDIACPLTPSPYTVKTRFFTSNSDTRDCSTCTCTASAGTCTATIDVYNAPSCGGTKVASVFTDGSCQSCPACDSAKAPTVTTNAGTCGNGGTGGPTGSAGATNPVTVCCTP